MVSMEKCSFLRRICHEKCSECLRESLIPLSGIGVLLNIGLLLPSMTVVKFQNLSDEVKYLPGIIGCGILIVFPVFSYLHTKRNAIEKCVRVDLCGPKYKMVHSIILAVIGILGALYGLSIAMIAIKRGPKCDIGNYRWMYPFHDCHLHKTAFCHP
ncbi:transmembrane 4 L6 family member 4-like isoform X2 [Macrotis lagotis]|uniref:transmembrane 4 L6 family member 4-like isoform X2 n=1 Tax=Macrotis lagotis TaxID=92651 RepID=UPI003D695C07